MAVEQNSSSLFVSQTVVGCRENLSIVCSTIQADGPPTTAEMDRESGDTSLYSVIEGLLYSRVITGICVLGIVGNMLNMVAMTALLLQKPMDRMERSATMGLLALAASDFVFCLTIVPYFFLGDFDQLHYDRVTFMLLFATYQGAVISTMIASSTWLTVVLAVSRFLAVCHPLRARYIIGTRLAGVSVVFAFLLSVLFNLPRFWHLRIRCVRLGDNDTVYLTTKGALQEHNLLERTYYTSYLVVGVIVPFTVLAYCNFFLIRALRRSSRMRKQFAQRRSGSRGRHSDTNVVTLTLTIIVIMYVVLVSPAEVSNIFAYMVQSRTTVQPAYNLAVAVANTLQTLNFSLNFVLYCTINAQFRRVIARIVTCGSRWSLVEGGSDIEGRQKASTEAKTVRCAVVASDFRQTRDGSEASNRWNSAERSREYL